MPDTSHLAVVDGRSTLPFRSDRAARAAISAWLQDGAEIIRRCRINNMYDYEFCRERIAEIAIIAIRSFDRHNGMIRDELEYTGLRDWIKREIAAEDGR